MAGQFKPGFRTILATLATVAAIVLAWFNVYQHRKFQPPEDGVTWQETSQTVMALHVAENSPGAKAGIRAGDVLHSVNTQKIIRSTQVTQILYRVQAWNRAEYQLSRQGHPFSASVIVEPKPPDPIRPYRLVVGMLYLGIGLFVLMRRPNAPRSRHFYIFCLASFALYFYTYTGKFNNFDWTIYWTNSVAWLVQPPLFLHFALVFPQTKPFVARYRMVLWLIYLPALLLMLVQVGVVTGVLRVLLPSGYVRWALDRMDVLHMGTFYAAAAMVLFHTYRSAETTILRQQMKWVTRGTVLAILPFLVFYVVPYFRGVIPTPAMNLSVLVLALIPLTFGYAILRWRLMDVDILFRRTVAYTVATAALVGLYFTVAALAGAMLRTALPDLGTWGLIIAVVVTAFLFEPLRGWIQGRLDRYFYQESYDYRRTLVEFGRELSADVHLDRMLQRVLERLSRTLNVEKVAVFLVDDTTGAVRIERSLGVSFRGDLNLGFLDPQRPEIARGPLFFENVRQAVAEQPAAQVAIAELDLNYYLPCRAQGRLVAFLGLGKTVHDDFLSTEDVELLETLSGYLGTAVENARLYRQLEQKVAEYERLKDYSENIVESVNVGILALDLDDRIESWNTQVELMFGLSRDRAVGCRIDEVFPAPLVTELTRLRAGVGEGSIHNLYKYRVRTGSGEERVFNVAVAPLVSKKFELMGRLAIFDDITEQIELEQQMAQAEKLSSVGLLAAGVAHEVNTPLAVISSYAQMLSKQLPENDPRWKLLEKITRSTFRASEIVNNLLNFSRTGSAAFSDIDVDQVIGDTLSLLEHQLRSGRVQVERSRAEQKPMVHGNQGKLQQVFLNLFLNAREAMPDGGTLHVATEFVNSSVRVRVGDTGQGIPKEHLHKIYDPFFTTKTAPAQRDTNALGPQPRVGTGLGLSVTYGIVREHSGRIQVHSEAGPGTTFVLEFPRSTAAATPPAGTTETAKANLVVSESGS